MDNKCFSSYFDKAKLKNTENTLRGSLKLGSSSSKKNKKKPKVLTDLKLTLNNRKDNLFFKKTTPMPYFNSNCYKVENKNFFGFTGFSKKKGRKGSMDSSIVKENDLFETLVNANNDESKESEMIRCEK